MKKPSAMLNHATAGFTAVLVGYTSSIAIIIQAASNAGASPAQIETWLFALGMAMGITSIGYSWYYKMPILTAWSTPGAAILVGSAADFSLAELIGAFIVSGLLIVLTGLISPLVNGLKRIPTPLATAMLAAILLPFCVRAFASFTTAPIVSLVVFSAFVLSKRFMPKYTMLVLLIVSLFCTAAAENSAELTTEFNMISPVWVTPSFDLSALLNIALPLYLVTMLSQNLPGIAVMKTYHYDTPVKPVLIGSGLINAISAPFGGFSLNLAAISAAMCMTDDVDADKSQRYRAAIWSGFFYLLAGILASAVVALFLAFPAYIIHLLAGLALLGTLLMCMQTAFQESHFREPALITFLVTLSGISLFGVGSTLLGLIAGYGYYVVLNSDKR